MRAVTGTKIFGIRLAINPKLLVGILFAFTAIVFFYNSWGDDAETRVAPLSAASPRRALTPSGSRASAGALQRRYANNREDLKLRPIDATRGDINPTLRFDSVSRLQRMPEPGKTRNLFEMASKPAELEAIHGPIILPGPLPVASPPIAPAIVAPAFSISLKYCGFLKSVDAGKGRRGFFLDDDNVLMGSEGDILKQRYLVVTLTPVSAQLKDVQLKKDQTLFLPAEVAR